MQLPEPFYRGKVRDLYAVDEQSMIIAASDRLSAFDVVFREPVPEKGRILNAISTRWFEALRSSGLMDELRFRDHLITGDVAAFPDPFRNHPDLAGRSVHVRRTERIDFECVVRGYLAGSGWKDYQRNGAVCGHTLPTGLRQAEQLPEPIFTPATKAEIGNHDENVTVETMRNAVGSELTERLATISLAIFRFASEKMAAQNILLCDTKFEFGLLDGEIVLIDEALTPDSSRYWNADTYSIGTSPPGYDKQFVRDYLEQSDWNKQPPPPALPAPVIEKTVQLYREIERRIETALS